MVALLAWLGAAASPPAFSPRAAEAQLNPRVAVYVLGVGESEVGRLTKPSVTELGSTNCHGGEYVQVNAVILGGGAGNSLTGQARCGGSGVASCVTKAPLDGLVNNCQKTGQQGSGAAGCRVDYATVRPPDSSWMVICQFE